MAFRTITSAGNQRAIATATYAAYTATDGKPFNP